VYLTQTLEQPGIVGHFPSVGRWIVTAMPHGWIYAANFGMRQMTMDSAAIAASVGLGQDTLGSDCSLVEYVEKQKKLVGCHFKDAKFAGPQAIAFAGAEEAQLLFVRHDVDTVGTMLHAQTFARSGNWLGIITLTSLEAQVRLIRPDYDAFVKGLCIMPQPMVEPNVGVSDLDLSVEKV